MRERQNYLRIGTGKNEGVYELKLIKAVSQDKDERVLCPCCKKPLRPLYDVIQWGFWQDKYRTFFLCKPCLTAWEYSYVVVCEVTEIKYNA